MDARIGRRLRLRDLHILLAVVQSGSMARAALQLAISQPAVSKAISDMEHLLGVRLLERSARGVEPTRYGAALVRRGHAVFNELSQTVREIDFLADPTVGELRVGTTDPIAASIVAPIVDALSREHPRVGFHVVTGDLSTLLMEVSARNVEFAISRLFDEVALTDMETEVLFHDPYAVVASICDAIAAGARPEQLGRALAFAAALRITRFHTQNDFGDWDSVHHAFTYANALHQCLVRHPSPLLLRGVVHGALRVYLDRFLNVPAARLPSLDGATDLAEKEDVDLRLYRVIYQVLDDIRQALTGLLAPEEREVELAHPDFDR